MIAALRASDRALSAYDLLETVNGSGTIYPATIYRSVERLCARGDAERVELRAAYRASRRPGCALLTCVICGRTMSHDADDLHAGLRRLVEAAGCAVGRLVLEAEVTCAGCSASTGQPEAADLDTR